MKWTINYEDKMGENRFQCA